MTYDLLVRNGWIIDGSGRPAFHGDVGVARGKIVELGRLDGPARRTIEADGRVVAPGFVDHHCHYDTVRPVAEDVVHDFPNDGWRMRELAEGIHYTVVNGEVLLEKGTHTGNLLGRVLTNARHQRD